MTVLYWDKWRGVVLLMGEEVQLKATTTVYGQEGQVPLNAFFAARTLRVLIS